MCKIFPLDPSKRENWDKLKVFPFQFLNDKIDQTTNFANLPNAKWLFFLITVNFIIKNWKTLLSRIKIRRAKKIWGMYPTKKRIDFLSGTSIFFGPSYFETALICLSFHFSLVTGFCEGKWEIFLHKFRALSYI